MDYVRLLYNPLALYYAAVHEWTCISLAMGERTIAIPRDNPTYHINQTPPHVTSCFLGRELSFLK